MLFSAAILLVVNLGLLGNSLGQAVPSADDVLQKASELANVPGLNASALPVEEAKAAFRKKCETNGGGAEAYGAAENAAKDLEACTRNLVNVTVLQDEIERAKPTGDLDTVFRKYCNKSPTLKNCVKNFTDTMEACLTQQERENLRIVQNITDSLLSFVCFKEGDRIALFIAAGGPECISSKQSVIQDCLNTTFGSYVPADGSFPSGASAINATPMLMFGTKECSDVERLQACVVRELETCSDPTPGNIVDSLFNFIKKVTPCENLLSKIRAEASIAAESKLLGASSVAGMTSHFGLVSLSLCAILLYSTFLAFADRSIRTTL